MKILKVIYRVSPFIAVALMLGFLGWLVGLHGTGGMLHIDSFFRLGLVVILIAVVFLAALAIWQLLLDRKPGHRLEIWFVAPVVLLTLIEITLPVAGFIYLNSPVSSNVENRIEISDTKPAVPGTLHFAVFSDAHFGSSNGRPDLSAKMLEAIANPANNYDCVFSAGDLVEFGFSDSQLQTAFNYLNPAFSAMPVGFIPGNHDTFFTGLEKYNYYCNASGSQLWQRYDIGDIHFLCLDIEWSAETFIAEQAAWLEEQLKSIPQNEWTIVIGHGHYYASGTVVNGWNWYDNPETIQAVTPLFEKYEVDMVFSGHVHQLEILEHSGVTYLVTGAFGGKLEPDYSYKSPASLWYAGGQYGFTDITINGDTAEIIFRDPDYNTLYSYALTK